MKPLTVLDGVEDILKISYSKKKQETYIIYEDIFVGIKRNLVLDKKELHKMAVKLAEVDRIVNKYYWRRPQRFVF